MEINFGTAVIESMPEGFTLIDSDWRYLYINQAALTQSRKIRSELIGYKITDVFSGFEKSDIYKVMAEVMESREAQDFVAKFEVPGGEDMLMELSIRPSADGIVIVSADLSLESEERKASLEQAVALAVKVVKQDGIEGYLFENSQKQLHI